MGVERLPLVVIHLGPPNSTLQNFEEVDHEKALGPLVIDTPVFVISFFQEAVGQIKFTSPL